MGRVRAWLQALKIIFLVWLMFSVQIGDGLCQGEIVLGMSGGFRSPIRGLAVEIYRGSMAYFEELNRQGGIAGRMVRIEALNDDYNPVPAIENTISLVEKSRVLLLFDYVGTPTVTRVLPLLKNYSSEKMFLFFPLTGAQPHREAPYAEYVFNLRPSYRREAEALVDHLVAEGKRRIAVFYQMDAYGRSGWDGVRRALAKHGLELCAEATYSRGTSFEKSLKEQVEILWGSQPEAVVVIGSYPACAAFIRDARDLGLDCVIGNISFVGSELMLKLLDLAQAASGRDYKRNLLNTQVVPSYEDVSLPAVREYRASMEKYSGVAPAGLFPPDYKPLKYSFVGFEGYLNAKMLTHILKSMENPLDRSKIRATVEAISNYDIGLEEPVSFGPGKHDGLSKVYITTFSGGHFVPVQSN